MQNIKFNSKINNQLSADVNLTVDTHISYGYGYGKLNGDFFHVFGINGELEGDLLVPTSEVIGEDAWIWIDGSSTPNLNGVYPGASGSIGDIGARWSSCFWKDLNGNFWVFGGNGFAETGTQRLTNDLWKYDIQNKEWHWIRKETISQAGDYSAGLGNVSPNGPGRRSGAVSWTDSNGMFWMFGGNGFASNPSSGGMLNDLWKYNPNTDEWFWMSGSSNVADSGTYPVSEGGTGTPRSRYRAFSWTDKNDNLWLFGGNNGFFTTILNDLWKYDQNTNQWFFIKGSKGLTSSGTYPENYGEVGIPCSRDEGSFCTDNDGNFWMFGGRAFAIFGLGGTSYGNLNDLWKFNVDEENWYFMGGTNTVNDFTTDNNSIPARCGGNMTSSTEDRLLLFGGIISSNTLPQDVYNDFWSYSITENKWYKLGDSSNNAGTYPSGYNQEGYPSSRRMAAIWMANDGNIFLFGGQNALTADNFNDLWEYRTTEKFLYGYGFEYTENIISSQRTKEITVTVSPDIPTLEEFDIKLRIVGNGYSLNYSSTTVNHIATFYVTDIYDTPNIETILKTVFFIENKTNLSYGYGYGKLNSDFFDVFSSEGNNEGYFTTVLDSVNNIPSYNYGYGVEYTNSSESYMEKTYQNTHIDNDKDTFFDIILEINNIKPSSNIALKTVVNNGSQQFSKRINLKANIN